MRVKRSTKLITFDTYGTLIDWNSTLIRYLEPLLSERGWTATPEEFYHYWYSRFALRAVMDEPYRPYRRLLQETLKAALDDVGLDVRERDGADFGNAMAESLPFEEVPEVMRELGRNYKLATISNSQHDILNRSSMLMGDPFDAMFTAEDTHAYKPDIKLFDLVRKHFGVRTEEIVHVAQSQHVDLPRSVPMGIATVWINRQGQVLEEGVPEPDAILTDMRPLPELLAAANRDLQSRNPTVRN